MDRKKLEYQLWLIASVYWRPESTIAGALEYYDALLTRLERAERIEAAARRLAESNADGPHPYDLRIDTVLSYRQRNAIADIMDALTDTPGERGKEGGRNDGR